MATTGDVDSLTQQHKISKCGGSKALLDAVTDAASSASGSGCDSGSSAAAAEVGPSSSGSSNSSQLTGIESTACLSSGAAGGTAGVVSSGSVCAGDETSFSAHRACAEVSEEGATDGSGDGAGDGPFSTQPPACSSSEEEQAADEQQGQSPVASTPDAAAAAAVAGQGLAALLSNGGSVRDASVTAAGGGEDVEDDDGDEPPFDFLCPISYEVMRRPVTVVETDVTYEQRAIEQWWFKRNQRSCPATQRLVRSMELKPNTALKERIDTWLDAHPDYVATLDQEDEVQQQLFGQVDSDAVAVHRCIEQLCSSGGGGGGGSGDDGESVSQEDGGQQQQQQEEGGGGGAGEGGGGAGGGGGGGGSAKSKALASLCERTGWADLPSTLLCTGAYLELVQVANVGLPEDKSRALRLLRHVAKRPDGLSALVEAGFLDTCVAALRDERQHLPGVMACRQQAVGTLLAMAGPGSGGLHTRARMLYGGVVAGLLGLLDSDGGEAVQDRAAKLMSKLADVDAHDFWRQLTTVQMQLGVRAGGGSSSNAGGGGGSGLDVLVDLLSSSSSRCQQYTLALMLRLATREAHRVQLIEAGCAAMPIRLLRSRHALVCEYAASLLYLFGTGEACKLRLLDMVGIAPFAALLMSDNEVCKRHGAGMLYQLIMEQETTQQQQVSSSSGQGQVLGMPLLVRGTGSQLKGPAQDKVCRAVVEQGGVSVLLGLLGQPEDRTQERGAALIGRLAAACKSGGQGGKEAVQVHFLDAGVVEPLVQLLCSESAGCSEQAAAAIGHLASASSAAKRAFVDAGAVRPLLALSQQPKGSGGAAAGRSREVADVTLRKLVGMTMHWYLLRTHKPSPAPASTSAAASSTSL